jgi:hypothetical protein
MKMNWNKLFSLIALGYGQGHGDDYRPFLLITRKNSSPHSNQSAGRPLPGYARQFHFQSRDERNVALVLVWLGAKDIREQFPLWPVAHDHPLSGAPGAENLLLEEAPGLLDLAREAGIDHGEFVGSDVPYIATMDLMVTVHSNGVPRLVAVSCKPRQRVLAADSASRMLERLELERLYCKELSIPHHIGDAAAFSRKLIANLQWLAPDKTVASSLLDGPNLALFCDVLQRKIHQDPIDQVIQHAASKVKWSNEKANSAFRFLAWHQEIDIDLSLPIMMTQPAKPGGQALRSALQKKLFGEIDDERL